MAEMASSRVGEFVELYGDGDWRSTRAGIAIRQTG